MRFGVRACLFGLVLGYVLTIPARWAGLMPAHLTWLGMTLVPASVFALLGSLFAGPLLLGRRWPWFFIPAACVCCLVMFAVIRFERGW